MTSGAEFAARIEQQIEVFRNETWAHPERKPDVLLGMMLAARIVRGEVPGIPDEGERT